MFFRACLILSILFALYFFLSKEKNLDKKVVEISKIETEIRQNSPPKEIKTEKPLPDTKSTHQNQLTKEYPVVEKIDSTPIIEKSSADEPKVNSRRKISDLNLDTLLARHIIKNKSDYNLSENISPQVAMLRPNYDFKLIKFKKNDSIYIANKIIIKELESRDPPEHFNFQKGMLISSESEMIFDKEIMSCTFEMNGRNNLNNSRSFYLHIEKAEVVQDVIKGAGVRVVFQKASDDNTKTNISAIVCFLSSNYGGKENLEKIEFIDFLAITNSYGIYRSR